MSGKTVVLVLTLRVVSNDLSEKERGMGEGVEERREERRVGGGGEAHVCLSVCPTHSHTNSYTHACGR